VARHRGARIPQDPRRSYERYLALAHAEALNGDRIAAENYFQHAEHYFRSMHPELENTVRKGHTFRASRWRSLGRAYCQQG